jgi:mannose/fructose/N-acetylgalactosamine-specific phosphotransferase system component IIC
MPPGAFVPLLAFVLVFWILGKIFRSLVLGGHWEILCLAALGFYAFAAQMVRDGQYVLALVLGWPLLFLGREGYKRLSND